MGAPDGASWRIGRAVSGAPTRDFWHTDARFLAPRRAISGTQTPGFWRIDAQFRPKLAHENFVELTAGRGFCAAYRVV
jgi:hypothetical protein